MDKIISEELQNNLDIIYHFSEYENELLLIEHLFKDALIHFDEHAYWEHPWKQMHVELKTLKENIPILENKFKLHWGEIENKIIILIESSFKNENKNELAL